MKWYLFSRIRSVLLLVPLIALVAAISASAVTPVPTTGAMSSAAQAAANGGAAIAPSQFLPERAGFTSWHTLAQVELTKQGKKMLPLFDPKVEQLDGKKVRIQGFMMPLDIGDKQKHFMLVAAPPHCSFCLPAGPDSMIEVRANADVRYGFDAISLTGKLQVLKDDPAGLYYRLVDAAVVQ